MTDTGPLVEVVDVSVRYGDADREVWALRDISLTVARGEFVSIIGPSGSGKTTLLEVIAGLNVPENGSVRVGGRDLSALSRGQRAILRRTQTAFIFQFFNLLPALDAYENVALPLRAGGLGETETADRVAHALELVGMKQRAKHYPDQLSGGEMQRLAIARGLATHAPLILADEPTGNLDSLRGEEMLELLKARTEERGCSVVLVTHDLKAAAYGDRIVTLRDGSIVSEVGPDTELAEIVDLPRRCR